MEKVIERRGATYRKIGGKNIFQIIIFFDKPENFGYI